MKNVIETLERYYQSFINQERDWNFFLGLADYVEFINKCPDFNQDLNKIEKSRLKEIEIINKFEKEAVNELQGIKRKVLKIIKGNISHKNKELLEALIKLRDYEKGKIDHAHYKSARLEDGLRNLIKVLCKNGYRSLLKNILSKDIKDEDITKNYSYYELSEKLSLRQEKSSELSEKKKIELWGAYKKLRVVFIVIYLGKKFLNTLEKYPDEYDRYIGFLEEMETIKNDEEKPFLFSLPSRKKSDQFLDYRKKEFKKDNYKLCATRIHNYLIQELSKEKRKKQETKTNIPNKQVLGIEQLLGKIEGDIKRKTKAKAKYNNGILYFRDKEINFRNKQNQKDLLATLFEDPKKNWYYDEIQEKWDTLKELNLIKYPKNYWRKFYSAGDDINTTIAIEAQVKDFIIKNTREIRINPKYI